MTQHREVYFKLERLDASDNVLEEKTSRLNSGSIKVTYDDINRRTAELTLLEPLPSTWMSSRWKPYYGVKKNGTVTYTPLGVFIPVNPEEEEADTDYITKLQGIDKAALLADAYSDIPITFVTGTSLKDVATTLLDMVGETRRNLADVPYTLTSDFTFEEGVTLEHIMSTLIRSFPADWYYDRNGYAVLEELPPADMRPVRYTFTEDNDSIYVQSARSIDTDKYWNKVTVVGGTVDTGIFRQTYQNDVHYNIAGRWVTKFFKEDAATSQEQVNQLAQQFLDAGTRLPATITLHNLPIADLEPKQIVKKGNTKYEVIEFDIPLSTDLQQLQAGEII